MGTITQNFSPQKKVSLYIGRLALSIVLIHYKIKIHYLSDIGLNKQEYERDLSRVEKVTWRSEIAIV